MASLLMLHAEGLNAYRARDWDTAERAFLAALELYPDDGPASMNVGRCRLLRDAPPPRDWDGVWNLTEK
jgi:adenylate cyclase